MAQVKTEVQMFPLVESWQKSGLTQKQFSQQPQISEQVFCYWVSRYRKAESAGQLSKAATEPPLATPAVEIAPGFIRLSPPVDPVLPTATAVIDAATLLELPSGVVVRFSGLVPITYLKELLTGIPV